MILIQMYCQKANSKHLRFNYNGQALAAKHNKRMVVSMDDMEWSQPFIHDYFRKVTK